VKRFGGAGKEDREKRKKEKRRDVEAVVQMFLHTLPTPKSVSSGEQKEELEGGGGG